MFNSLRAYPDSEIPKSRQGMLFTNFVRQEFLAAVLEGSVYSKDIYEFYGAPLPRFFIHPEGYIYNTNVDKHTLERFLLFNKGTTLDKKIQKEFRTLRFAHYEIEYPEYYWDTVAESSFKGRFFLIHMNPARQYEIYINDERIPRQIVSTITELSKKIFHDKAEYSFVQDLIQGFAGTKVERCNAKYQEIDGFPQLPAILHAIRKGLRDESLVGDLENKLNALSVRADAAVQVFLLRELKYMRLLACFRPEDYGIIRDLLTQIQQSLLPHVFVHFDFDAALLEYQAGHTEQALALFTKLAGQADSATSVPALFNCLALLLQENRRAEAIWLFLQKSEALISPSPKTFPQLYEYIQHAGAFIEPLSPQIYDREELQDLSLYEDDLDFLLDLIATEYTPQLYYTREHDVRNFYLKIFGENVKRIGDVQKLKALYIARGMFGMHQLLQDFLRTEKYTQKIGFFSQGE